MKKILSFLSFTVLVLQLNAQTKEFTITGSVQGLDSGIASVTTTEREPTVLVSDSLKDGKFYLKGSVEEPGLYFLIIGDEQPKYIYLENVAYTVSGQQSDMKQLKIEGSTAHNDFLDLNRIFNPVIGELNAVVAQIEREGDPKVRDPLIAQYDSIIISLKSRVNEFVSAKKSSHVSPFLLWITARITADVIDLEKNFNLLDESVRSAKISQDLSDYIRMNKIGIVGTEAIDFVQADTSGKDVSLFSFKGQYVLVDFWASWCVPCRKENPNLVKAFNKFKDKNFTILGVSLDAKKDDWIKAIHKDKLAWHHVSDLQSWNNAAAQLYRIQSIPGNMLIDPNGKIIAKDLRGEDLEKALAQYLGESAKKK